MSDTYGFKHQPTEIRVNREDKTLEIDFDDGKTFALPAELLRVESPSAEVQGHAPDEKRIVAGRKHVSIMEVAAVGNYAITIKFDDLHDSGIYSWETLYDFGENGDAIWAEYEKNLEANGLSREP